MLKNNLFSDTGILFLELINLSGDYSRKVAENAGFFSPNHCIEYYISLNPNAEIIIDEQTHQLNTVRSMEGCGDKLLELGDKEYWDTKDETFKRKMSEVYKKQVEDLELLVPNFKVASAIIHFDETSPHFHIVGVPIKYKNKNGMEKQVGKSNVFTKESFIRK